MTVVVGQPGELASAFYLSFEPRSAYKDALASLKLTSFLAHVEQGLLPNKIPPTLPRGVHFFPVIPTITVVPE
jgi:hypothetical protein